MNYREPAIYDIPSDSPAPAARAGSAKPGSAQSADEAAAEEFDWEHDRRIVEVLLAAGQLLNSALMHCRLQPQQSCLVHSLPEAEALFLL